MDYNKKYEELESSQISEWFKPQAGTYKCIVLAEPEEVLKTFFKGTDREEVKAVLSVKMEANGNAVTWDVGVTKGFSSAYGQLILLGKKHGKLCGCPFTLIVKRSKDKNDYTIVEAVDLMPQKEQQKI